MLSNKKAVPPWGMKTSVKHWLIKHWLYEAVMEVTAYIKIGSYLEARLVCRMCFEINRELWLYDVIWYEDYLDIDRMLHSIYYNLWRCENDCRTCESVCFTYG